MSLPDPSPRSSKKFTAGRFGWLFPLFLCLLIGGLAAALGVTLLSLLGLTPSF